MNAPVLRFAGLAITPWHNGAGRKADIASGPGWHIGFAWLDDDAPFSDFTGQDRTITLIDGPGFLLDFASASPLRVDAPFRPAAFDGSWPTQCRLLGGPGLVLNAMTDRRVWRHSVAILDTASPRIEPGAAEACFAIVLSGTVTTDEGDLASRDALRIDAPASLRTSHGARVCVVEVTRA